MQSMVTVKPDLCTHSFGSASSANMRLHPTAWLHYSNALPVSLSHHLRLESVSSLLLRQKPLSHILAAGSSCSAFTGRSSFFREHRSASYLEACSGESGSLPDSRISEQSFIATRQV